ncbi:hypothetical protein UY3_12953 [Chelonia mydas]|uniref:Uncharacterized protein n=1 Tax=Chelonia mydas TaxID=8469 RepID=M7AWU8_CHEMY|nr:hypothetical protein UY3_12953 [Chelonia mydas]
MTELVTGYGDSDQNLVQVALDNGEMDYKHQQQLVQGPSAVHPKAAGCSIFLSYHITPPRPSSARFPHVTNSLSLGIELGVSIANYEPLQLQLKD